MVGLAALTVRLQVSSYIQLSDYTSTEKFVKYKYKFAFTFISTHCWRILPFSPLSAAFPWRSEMQLWPAAGHSAYSRHYDNCSFPLAPWNDFQDCHHESIQWPQERFLARVERTHKSWQENETGHYQHLELIKRWFVGILGLVGGQK